MIFSTVDFMNSSLYELLSGCRSGMSILPLNHLVGLVFKASVPRVEDPGFEPRFAVGFFPDRVTPMTYKMALQWLHGQAPDVIGSALELVGQMSVYCDWVRQKSLNCNF